jgi:hypothetical protein
MKDSNTPVTGMLLTVDYVDYSLFTLQIHKVTTKFDHRLPKYKMSEHKQTAKLKIYVIIYRKMSTAYKGLDYTQVINERHNKVLAALCCR